MRIELKKEQINRKYQALSRSFLDRESAISEVEIEETGELCFFQIKGLANFWDREENLNYDSIFMDILSGLHSMHTTFVYALVGSRTDISVYIGMTVHWKEALKSSLKSVYPYIHLTEISNQQMKKVTSERSQFGGTFMGYPTNKTSGENEILQIERLCTGLLGEDWAYIVVAKGIHSLLIDRTHERLLDEMELVSQTLKVSTSSGGAFGDESSERTRFINQRYLENLEMVEQRLETGRAKGMWRMSGYFLAAKSETAQKLRNLLISTYLGDKSRPEKVRALHATNMHETISTFPLMANQLPFNELEFHPLGQWMRPGNETPIQSFIYRYQTLVSSEDLATFSQIPRKEMPGYFVNPYVEFEVAERRENGDFVLGNIVKGNEELEQNRYSVPTSDFNRHGLIVGMTGGGKSNTSKSLLMRLWNDHKKPFLVIESAKREYWELANVPGFADELLVFTLGAEDKDSVPFRINPFEKVGDVPLQTHIDYLLSTFKASFELVPPMPFVLETAVYRIYENLGWDILKNENVLGIDKYPTLDDLLHTIDDIVTELGYDQRMKSDITAALKARVTSLKVGGKGAMMNTAKSVSMEKLLSRPVVMELEDIGDDDVKAFVMGILLVQLYEYRKQKLKEENVSKKEFEHLIVIEEAHRLLANVSKGGEGANPRAKAVEFFTNLLAEIRSYGQGFLIADQVPTKLAPDTLKNTNLKIVHRIVMKEDRELIGQSMNMNEEQIDYISTLKRGYAAVYAEGDARPKLVKMPLVDEVRGEARKYRDQVITEMRETVKREVLDWEQLTGEAGGCPYCQGPCQHKELDEKIKAITLEKGWHVTLAEKLPLQIESAAYLERYFELLQKNGYVPSLTFNQKRCCLSGLLELTKLPRSSRQKLMAQYLGK
ncbi:DUF87 domain-containing protein [Bacillus sp. DTU_2020_1000418_1_SI_GHA_SEK_038]|uniref:ATP-binding protein n=1 Tax=Bacillus sp. DTU_2020_1000418_1_SI_GHA_SEK_038 TaxID=3077585 RepID=UPI0028EA4A67|nr:DUF87 domain-containing protein [Bacillus sp. DTU_2020_1000418_1_SI_GHA_SEK_038]WNS77437.1 DUF87 domain-containing protein [Bacillus sp. DTU_2020_1000418_1_SI_GHA_SEK_038]